MMPHSPPMFDDFAPPMPMLPAYAGVSVTETYEKTPPPPSIDDLVDELDRLKPRFHLRNNEIAFWRGICRLSEQYGSMVNEWRQSADTEDDRPISITDPAAIINGIIRRLGGLGVRFQAAADDARHESLEKAAKSELFLRAAWHRFNLDHRAAGWGLSRQGAIARYLAEDGHCYERKILVPERDEMPFTTKLLDPVECIPKWGMKRGVETLVRLYHETSIEVGELREHLQKRVLPQFADNAEIDIVNFYSPYHTGVFFQREWVRRPVEHHFGCMPIQATFHNGLVSGTQFAGRMTVDQREAYRGRSIIADHVGTILRMGDHLAAMQRALYKAVDPPYTVDPGTSPGIEVNNEPGGITVTSSDAKVGALPQSPVELKTITTLMEYAQNSLRADLLFIDPSTARASGFDRVVASLEAQETFAQLVDAIEAHDSAGAELLLYVVQRMTADEEIAVLIGNGYLTPDPSKPLRSVPLTVAQGGRQVRAMFSATDVPRWIRVNVKLETLSTVNKAQLGSQLMALHKGGVMSLHKVMEMLDEPDPQAEIDRIRRDLVLSQSSTMEGVQPLYQLEFLQELARRHGDAGNDTLAAMADLMMMILGRDTVMRLQMPPQQPAPPPGTPGPVPMLPDPQMGLAEPGLPMPIGTRPGMTPPEIATGGANRIDQTLAAMAGMGGM